MAGRAYRRAAPVPDGRRRRVRRAAAALLAVVVVAGLVALTVPALDTAAGRARSGSDELERARSATVDVPTLLRAMAADPPAPAADRPPGGADLDAAVQALERAAGHFDAVAAELAGRRLAPARVAPVLGRQLDAVEALARSAAAAARRSASTLRTLAAAADAPTADPAARVDAARTAAAAVAGLRAELAALDLGPDEALLTPVAAARNRFAAELADLDATLGDVAAALDAVVRLLGGPSRYLLLAANNAEMRAGGGMFLQAGALVVHQGRLSLDGPFVPAEELLSAAPGGPLDADLDRLWGWTGPDRDLRNANLTPRFDVAAATAADLWARAGRGPVDGVLAIDVIGLRHLLGVIGPVEVPVGGDDRSEDVAAPQLITPGNVTEELLLGQYERFDRRDERRDVLGATAAAVFVAFDRRGWSAVALASALQRAGAARHLMLWSTDPGQQAGWEALGAAGRVDADALLLSLLNGGGNKLDQFVEVAADLRWGAAVDGRRQVTVVVDLHNAAPEGLPDYVAGPHPGTDLAPGEYLGLLSLTVPGRAGDPTMDGAALSVSGDDGTNRVVAGEVRLAPGERRTIRVTVAVPADLDRVTVLPSARWPELRWRAGGDELPTRRPAVVVLEPRAPGGHGSGSGG